MGGWWCWIVVREGDGRKGERRQESGEAIGKRKSGRDTIRNVRINISDRKEKG